MLDSTYIQQLYYLSTTITLLGPSYDHSPHITIISVKGRKNCARNEKKNIVNYKLEKRNSPKSIPTMQLPPTPAPRFLLFTNPPNPSYQRPSSRKKKQGMVNYHNERKTKAGKLKYRQRVQNTTKDRNKK